MPSYIYDSLNLGPLKKTGVVIELADRSNVYPKRVLDDVLVQVDNLIFWWISTSLTCQKDVQPYRRNCFWEDHS